MATELTSEAVLEAASEPYPVGWTDRLQAFAERLPGPLWVTYGAIAVGIFAIITGIKWTDETYPIGTLFAFHALPGATLAYGLALMHYLDRYAAKALTNYSAARNTSQAEVARLERELTSLPAAGAAWAAVAGAALMGVVYATVSPASAVASELLVLTSPAARVAELVVSVAMWAVLGTLVYHSVRQLRVVSDIYTRSTVVNLYRVSPLYALASLTARTAVGILVVPYSWFLLQPRSQEILTSWPYTLGFSVLAVVTFLLPLLGIHELLERDKKRLLLETSTRLEAAIAALHAHADASDYSTMSGHHDLLASLALEQAALEKISTWPWRPETPRILATAVLTPLLVFIAQRLLTSLLKL